MEPKLTTLCTYPSAIQAETVKWALEQEGITTFVADSNTITADWLLGPAVGWVKVQVAEADAVAARAVLEKRHGSKRGRSFAQKDTRNFGSGVIGIGRNRT